MCRMPMRHQLLLLLLVLPTISCKDQEAIARVETLEVKVTEQQSLANQLAAQKDSLVRVVLDADAFLGQMDSAISSVKGIARARRSQSDPLAAQLQARKDMQQRVNALVLRATTTANQLAALQRRQMETQSVNTTLREQLNDQATKIDSDAQLIADLGATIERQNTQIATLESRLDSLSTEVRTLEEKLNKAYFVVGTEKELLERGVVVKEGGANLLIARPGRTIVPARVLNPVAFTEIDQRQVSVIQVPDTTRRYRLISRQNLDAAEVSDRQELEFRGNLRITKPEEFWGPSRFLILLQL
jgi:hypothetical protein